jgi:hypothetical protein
MSGPAIAAIVFAVVTAGVVAFQVALALGAPWGAYAMGGARPGRFSAPMRAGALGQALILALLAVAVLAEAGLVLPTVSASLPWLIWLAVAFSAVGVVLNAISRSAGERRLWLPLALVMLVASLVVALA